MTSTEMLRPWQALHRKLAAGSTGSCRLREKWLLTSIDVVISVEPASTATTDSAPPPVASGIATTGSAGLPEAGEEATDRTLP
jgi:hypothetical protein